MGELSDSLVSKEHISVVAFSQSGLVLVVQKEGYYEQFWRLPHCERMRSSDNHPEGQLVIDKSSIRRLLKGTIGCEEREIGEISDTRERARFNYPGHMQSYDVQTTQQLFRVQNLAFYTAELLCPDGSFKKGSRIIGLRMVRKDIAREVLIPPESDVAVKALEMYFAD